MALTRKQHGCLVFITEYISKNGHGPIYQVIADHLGLRSLASVKRLVDILIRNGYVVRPSVGSMDVVPAKLHGVTQCSRGHEPIWFFAAACPLCATLRRLNGQV